VRIRCGFNIAYELQEPLAMLLALSLHPSRQADLLTASSLVFSPHVNAESYIDGFGNLCHRLLAPAGRLAISCDFEIADFGLPDPVVPDARQCDVWKLPPDTLAYLLGSRYCETDKLGELAWSMFRETEPGWRRVQAICDFTHQRIEFGYPYGRPDKSALDVLSEGKGVCRDFAHLAIALCRSMNIPARYCTGYLGDIGVPRSDAPMDFSAWFEAYLLGPNGGQWYPFDARHNIPRIGRILMARGRDATDVALTITIGQSTLSRFEVFTEELPTGE
jgi:transglutaminase-like putative cysteine protease